MSIQHKKRKKEMSQKWHLLLNRNNILNITMLKMGVVYGVLYHNISKSKVINVS